MSISRRGMLFGTSSVGALACLFGVTNVNAKMVIGSSANDRQTITKMIKTLYPHERFPDGPYQRTTDDVIGKGNADPAKTLMMRDGLADLRKASFDSLNFREATNYLKGIEGSAFFSHVRGTSVVTLYNDKEVWDLLGYEGASYEKGGYVNRGFNDLNWLPEPRITEHPDHANFFIATQNKLAELQQINTDN